MDFKRRAQELRSRIASARRVRRRGRIYAPELRRDIEAYVGDRLAAGGSTYAAARELGLGQTSVSRWLRQARRDPGLPHLRPVTVLPSTPAPAVFSIAGPRGIRIDGVDVDSLVELIRRLA